MPQEPIVEHGDKVLIVTRRLFAADARRHFVGSVDRHDGSCFRVHGYAFVLDTETSQFVRRKSQRTRLFKLDNHLVIFILPSDTDLSKVRYERRDGDILTVTDGASLNLNLNEMA